MPRERPAPRTPSPLHEPAPTLHTLAGALLVLCAALACRPPSPCGPPGAPPRLQLLAAASDAPNLDDDDAPWPVNLRIYELGREPAPESLDFTALFTDAKAVLGDSLIATHEQTAFPAQRYRWTLDLAPDTAHLLVAGLFRRPVGDAWYLLLAAPARDGATCHDPCVFLTLDRGELAGGRFPPAGFPVDAFATTCPPVVTPRPGASR